MFRVSSFVAPSIMLLLSACAPEGSTAYVSFIVPPGADCVVPVSATKFIPIGQYDISRAGKKIAMDGVKASALPDSRCSKPYIMAMLVNSSLKQSAKVAIGRAEPNVLQITSAEVHLMTGKKETILFNRKGSELRNPFTVTANNTLRPASGSEPSVGVVAVEAIPVGYAEQLNTFSDSQILAEVQIFGTTLGGVDIDFKPFVFPIRLCSGCLTECATDLVAMDISAADVYGDNCPDNAGADGRVCIDPDC